MIPVPSGVRVWIAAGHTDMRCGMNSLAFASSNRCDAIRMRVIFMSSEEERQAH